MLVVCKSAVALLAAAQTEAAASIAGRESHGDGGAEVLADTAGLSRREAHSQVKTASVLRGVPAVREAVETGRVPTANARRLAEVITKTNSKDVGSDAGLLAKAESLRPEAFAREARRWVVSHDRDDGTAEHARQRARRCVRVCDGDDGMVLLRGEFDAITGRRIGNRLRAEARRLYDTDKQTAKASAPPAGGSGHGVSNRRAATAGFGPRSFDQCMADALDALTASRAALSTADGAAPSTTDRGAAGTIEGAAASIAGRAVSGTADGAARSIAGRAASGTIEGAAASIAGRAVSDTADWAARGIAGRAALSTAGRAVSGPADGAVSSIGTAGGVVSSWVRGGEPFADICVVAHVDDETGKLVAETPDGHKLPAAVFERLACNARFTGVLYGGEGSPIWRAKSQRRASDPQRQILFARYGGCFHCSAHLGLCQIHHIKPVSAGGKTVLKNLVPVCWDCHNLIHHHRWWIKLHPDGDHTLHPPEHTRYGPAHNDHGLPPMYAAAADTTPDPPPSLFNPTPLDEPPNPGPGRHASHARPGPAAARATLHRIRGTAKT